MNLEEIKIRNYRSIEDLTLQIDSLNDDSKSFGLIGVNEAGKSTILKAIALKDKLIQVNPKDFKDKEKQIEIAYNYSLQVDPFVMEHLTSIGHPDASQVTTFQINTFYNYNSPNEQNINFSYIGGDTKLTSGYDEKIFNYNNTQH